MCVAAILNNTPTLPEIGKMMRANPNGVGVAWRQGRQVFWKKGTTFSAKEIHKLIEECPKPCLFHARLTSVGRTTAGLCHPFPIDQGQSTATTGSSHRGVLIHNGHWSSWDDVFAVVLATSVGRVPGGEWTDSRLIARMVERSTVKLVGQAIGAAQKVAVMTPTRILTCGYWIEHDGNFYSNLYWQNGSKVYSSYTSGPVTGDVGRLPLASTVVKGPDGKWSATDRQSAFAEGVGSSNLGPTVAADRGVLPSTGGSAAMAGTGGGSGTAQTSLLPAHYVKDVVRRANMTVAEEAAEEEAATIEATARVPGWHEMTDEELARAVGEDMDPTMFAPVECDYCNQASPGGTEHCNTCGYPLGE